VIAIAAAKRARDDKNRAMGVSDPLMKLDESMAPDSDSGVSPSFQVARSTKKAPYRDPDRVGATLAETETPTVSARYWWDAASEGLWCQGACTEILR
jgi:hypothetical protein